MPSKDYDDGYKTGHNWKNSWIPGGPYVCDDETKKTNKTWKEGFFDGLEVCRYKKSDAVEKLFSKINLGGIK